MAGLHSSPRTSSQTFASCSLHHCMFSLRPTDTQQGQIIMYTFISDVMISASAAADSQADEAAAQLLEGGCCNRLVPDLPAGRQLAVANSRGVSLEKGCLRGQPPRAAQRQLGRCSGSCTSAPGSSEVCFASCTMHPRRPQPPADKQQHHPLSPSVAQRQAGWLFVGRKHHRMKAMCPACRWTQVHAALRQAGHGDCQIIGCSSSLSFLKAIAALPRCLSTICGSGNLDHTQMR